MRLQLALLLIATLAQSASASAEPADETQVTSDYLVYVDSDNVSVLSPQIGVRHPIDEDGGEVSARVVLDAITAASVDVISNATYRFSELRTEVEVGVSKEVAGVLPSISYRVSSEPDYVSHSFSTGLSKTFAGGDATASVNYSGIFDRVGRVGTSSSVFSESLQTHAASVSLTQVLDPKTLVRGTYSLTAQSGYMEKPYRSVPIFDSGLLQLAEANGVTLGLDNFDDYRLAFKPSEEVPNARYRHAAAARVLRFVDAVGASVRGDYRFYGDSWGMFAHTAELALAKSLPRRFQLDTWARAHYQGGVDFWRKTYSVSDPNAMPSLRTTDKSLSPYWQATAGIRAGKAWGSWQAYVQLAGMYTGFLEHLFIDRRFAIVSQGGLRWQF